MHLVSNIRSVIVTGALMLILFSCSEQDKKSIEASASAFDIKQAEASIAQSNQNFMKSFKAGDSLGVASCYATEAKIMAPDMPTQKGKDDITHFISKAIKKGLRDYDLNTIKVWGDSSIVAEEGTYTVADTAGKRIDKGKYIVLWKQESGNWKMFRDIWASDLSDTTITTKKHVVSK